MRHCLELLEIMTETRHVFGDLEKMKPSKLSFLVVLDIVLLALGAVMVDQLVMMVLVALGAVGALDGDGGGGGGGEERKGNWRRPRRS